MKNLDTGFAAYTLIGLSLLNFLLYSAYYLTRPLWVEPDLVFLTVLRIQQENFSLHGYAVVLLSISIASLAVLLSGRLQWPSTVLWVVAGYAASFLSSLVIMPFSTMLAVLYIGLTSVVVGGKAFRHFVTLEGLPPDVSVPKSHPFFPDLVKLAHDRWLQLQRDSIWITATVVFAQLLQSVITFQANIFPYLAPIHLNPYPIIFARYQFAIIGLLFLWYVAGLGYGTTFFCYRKLLALEKMMKE